MLNFDFEKDLLDAIEKALQGSGIKATHVLSFIEPVIEKHSTQSVEPASGTCLGCGFDNGDHAVWCSHQ